MESHYFTKLYYFLRFFQGWSVSGNCLMFNCDKFLNKMDICSMTVISIQDDERTRLQTEPYRNSDDENENENIEDNYPYHFSLTLAVGSLDSRLKMIEIDNHNNFKIIYRENGNLDLQRDTRYLEDFSENNQVTKISDFSTNYTEDYKSTDRKSIRNNNTDPGPALRKESSFIPISLKYIRVGNDDNNGINDINVGKTNTNISSAKMRQNGVRTMKTDLGIIVVVTPSAILRVKVKVRTHFILSGFILIYFRNFAVYHFILINSIISKYMLPALTDIGTYAIISNPRKYGIHC